MHKQSTGRVRRDGKQWSEILRRLKSSELETKEFCRREGVALSSLQRWRRRLGSVDSADFVELVPSSNPDAPSSKWSLEVSLPNGASLRFQG
jgi:transposase-like protein